MFPFRFPSFPLRRETGYGFEMNEMNESNAMISETFPQASSEVDSNGDIEFVEELIQVIKDSTTSCGGS